mmetsp:Transcript_12452/g.18830  ORF Transcript_12452/g.18830 Transcript_12452/m.18830 type:complete len:189 (-) Transcript_12452:121-687(-)
MSYDEETSMTEGWTYIFVYGTLKTSYTNYIRYMKPALDRGHAKYIGAAVTVNVYPLVLRPITRLPDTRGPMLLTTHNSSDTEWSRVQGEIYCVNAVALEALDILEGVRSGYYYRENIEVVRVSPEDEMCTCQCYFYRICPDDDDLLNERPLLKNYDDVSHEEYSPRPINEEIMSLLNGDACIDSHIAH